MTNFEKKSSNNSKKDPPRTAFGKVDSANKDILSKIEKIEQLLEKIIVRTQTRSI